MPLNGVTDNVGTKSPRDARRFVVHADEKLTAFPELESAFRSPAIWIDKSAAFSSLASIERSESGVGLRKARSRRFFPFFRPGSCRVNPPRERKVTTMNPSIQLKTTPPLLIILMLLCFGLLPKAQAVSPPPDGGYPNGNTAEGENALLSPTNGFFVAFSAKALEQAITLVQLEAGASDNATLLIGHWRKTTTLYGSVRDEHLVFYPDGTVDNWAVAISQFTGAESREGKTTGRWEIEGKLLIIDWGDKQSSRPFFFHQGQLVWPNIPNARRYWDRVR